MRSRLAVCLLTTTLIIVAAPAPAVAQVDARMLRYPDVSSTHIAFVYAGDIWVVPKTGGVAQRLSSPPGEESYPRFSPDGSHIAFSGNYDGNSDVYVVPALGGALERVTYHPGSDRLVDWTPDGAQLVFASRRHSGVQRFNQLFTIAAQGGLPERLPVAYGEFGALSSDGRWLAFTPKDRGTRNWKRYRGGMAPDIWLFDLETYEATNISESDANEMRPMFYGRTVYFVSDRGDAQRMNIWAYDLDEEAMRQVTRFEEFDITLPAIGPEEIVFQAGGRLYLLALSDEQVREVEVEVVIDMVTLRPRTESVSTLIVGGGISPSRARALFEARGEIFTVPAENGIVRNLTRSSGAAERYPAWSPDGKSIAYWSDRSDEYELMLRPAAGGEETQLTQLGPGYRYRAWFSPASDKIAFIDSQQRAQPMRRIVGDVTHPYADDEVRCAAARRQGDPALAVKGAHQVAQHLTQRDLGLELRDPRLHQGRRACWPGWRRRAPWRSRIAPSSTRASG